METSSTILLPMYKQLIPRLASFPRGQTSSTFQRTKLNELNTPSISFSHRHPPIEE